MTFRELFAALYGRRLVSVATTRTALRHVVALPPGLHAAWVEYRDGRLETRHAR